MLRFIASSIRAQAVSRFTLADPVSCWSSHSDVVHLPSCASPTVWMCHRSLHWVAGDSACSIPPQTIPAECLEVIRDWTVKLAKELNVVGLINIQYCIQDNQVCCGCDVPTWVIFSYNPIALHAAYCFAALPTCFHTGYAARHNSSAQKSI